jgi:hypothetical protein
MAVLFRTDKYILELSSSATYATYDTQAVFISPDLVILPFYKYCEGAKVV